MRPSMLTHLAIRLETPKCSCQSHAPLRPTGDTASCASCARASLPPSRRPLWASASPMCDYIRSDSSFRQRSGCGDIACGTLGAGRNALRLPCGSIPARRSFRRLWQSLRLLVLLRHDAPQFHGALLVSLLNHNVGQVEVSLTIILVQV